MRDRGTSASALRVVFAWCALAGGCASEPRHDTQSPQAPNGAESVPAGPPQGKRAPCTLGVDQACNEDPSVSALWGRCTEFGVCECKPGFELSPESKLCRPAR